METADRRVTDGRGNYSARGMMMMIRHRGRTLVLMRDVPPARRRRTRQPILMPASLVVTAATLPAANDGQSMDHRVQLCQSSYASSSSSSPQTFTPDFVVFCSFCPFLCPLLSKSLLLLINQIKGEQASALLFIFPLCFC